MPDDAPLHGSTRGASACADQFGLAYVALGYAGRTVATAKPGVLAGQAPIVMPALPAGQALYAKLGVTEATHLLLDLDRTSGSDPDRLAPGSRGLTGGAWSAPRTPDAARPAERLLGYFVEYESGGVKTIVVTRIGAALEGIKRNFPELREALEVK